jgi:hypothetical protein
VKFLPAFLLRVKARCQLSCIQEFLVRRPEVVQAKRLLIGSGKGTLEVCRKHKNGRHLSKVTPCSYRNPLGMRRAVATQSPIKGNKRKLRDERFRARQLPGLITF